MRFVRGALFTAAGIMGMTVALLFVTLMLPVKIWRTGELPSAPLAVEPAPAAGPSPARVWIDTDAACGQGGRIDPDDCLAILLLAQDDGVEIVGISTVFGNASLVETDRTARALMALVEEDGRRRVPVYRGSSNPVAQEASIAAAPPPPAHEGLRAALEREPLTLVALGPLTNIALALKDRSDLQANVTRLIAVMGRRKGHVFHPIEGGAAHSFLGHGPIFRDLNVTEDAEAAARVVAMGVPITLIPYEAARDVLLDPIVLEKMEGAGGAAAWVARRARGWLAYWREDIGLDGFYPFDLVAAASVIEPSLLRCADVPIAVEDDTWLFGWLGYRGLFVAPDTQADARTYATGSAFYCPEVSEHLEAWLANRLTSVHAATGDPPYPLPRGDP